MIVLAPGHLKQITDLAEAAYPRECCGLLIGTEDGAGEGTWRVTKVAPSENLAPDDRNDRFEVDPLVRLRLQKELRGTSESLIGIYHSHPDGPAQPSVTDLENAWEPELTWLITAVVAGQAIQTNAFRLADQASRFAQISLRTADWHAAPSRSQVQAQVQAQVQVQAPVLAPGARGQRIG